LSKEWINDISEIIPFHIKCNSFMILESNNSNKNSIFLCPRCSIHVKIEVK